MSKPTLESNNQSTHPNQDSTGKTGPSGSSMETTTLVPNPAGNANTQTGPTTQQAGLDTINSQSQSSRHDITFRCVGYPCLAGGLAGVVKGTQIPFLEI